MTTVQAAASGMLVAGQCQGSNVGPIGSLRRGNGSTTGGVPFVAATLRSRESSPGINPPGRGGEDDANLVAYTVHGEHSTAMTGAGDAQVAFESDKARSLDSTGGYATNQGGTIIQAFESTIARNGRGAPAETTRALRASEDGGRADCRPMVFESRIGRSGRGQPSEVAGALKGSQAGETSDMRPMVFNPHRTLQKDGSGTVEGFKPDSIVDALHGPTGNKEPLVGGVRRLTPTETLRLMSLPDDWLDLDPPLSDSAKYRMVGNSVVVNVVEWIVRRLAALGS